MDFGEQKELLVEYVNDDSLDRWDDVTRGRYLNIWYQKMLNEYDWIFTQDIDSSILTTPNVAVYAKPTLVQKILGVYITVNGYRNKVSYINRKQRDSLPQGSTGIPRHYHLLGDNIFLYPTPDQPYYVTIEYSASIPNMVDESDEPIFDEAFHYLIPLGAAVSLKNTSGGSQINEGSALTQEYLAGMERMKNKLLPGEDDRPDGVINVIDINGRDMFGYT